MVKMGLCQNNKKPKVGKSHQFQTTKQMKNNTGIQDIHIIFVMVETALLTEGQAMKALGLNRLEYRRKVMQWKDKFESFLKEKNLTIEGKHIVHSKELEKLAANQINKQSSKMKRDIEVGDKVIDIITKEEIIIIEITDDLSWRYNCSNGYSYDRDGFIINDS